MFPFNNQMLGFSLYARQCNTKNPEPNNLQPNPSLFLTQTGFTFDPQMAAYMQYLHSRAPNPNMAFGSQPQPNDDETVSETQPVLETRGGRGRKHAKKAIGEPQTKKKTIMWKPEEYGILARAWCAVSEDPEPSNFQSVGTFWLKIEELFH